MLSRNPISASAWIVKIDSALPAGTLQQSKKSGDGGGKRGQHGKVIVQSARIARIGRGARRGGNAAGRGRGLGGSAWSCRGGPGVVNQDHRDQDHGRRPEGILQGRDES